jgi:hypothetical protein
MALGARLSQARQRPYVQRRGMDRRRRRSGRRRGWDTRAPENMFNRLSHVTEAPSGGSFAR